MKKNFNEFKIFDRDAIMQITIGFIFASVVALNSYRAASDTLKTGELEKKIEEKNTMVCNMQCIGPDWKNSCVDRDCLECSAEPFCTKYQCKTACVK